MRVACAVILLLLPGCLVDDPDAIDPATVEVPPGLRVTDATYRAAYVFAAERVGRADFDRLYVVDRVLTGPAPLQGCAGDCSAPWFQPHDWVVFEVRVPVGDFGSATIPMASNGTQVLSFDDQPYGGLPDCKARPRSCDFHLDADDARAAALRHGLQERGCPLEALAGWHAQLQRFVWETSDRSCPSRSESGRSVSVDVATGRVVDESTWSLIID